ncbi:MAG TPA: ABC transporter permease [Candidatus Dormibacteraeota bacterium]|nr:ABC transporter permease [Candidatus Dormibacteraeota bacterium]
MLRLPDREDFQNFFLIARREFVTRIRSRFFQFGTLILVVALAGYIVLQAEVISKATSTVKVGFVGPAQSLAQPLQAAAASSGLTVQVHDVSSVGAGEAQVRDGTLDALVSGQPTGPDVAVKDKLDPTVEATLDGLVKETVLNQAIAQAGGDPSTILAQVARAGIHLVQLDANATRRTQSTVVGLFVAILLYTALTLYGQFVAAGVVEEKSNRIVEILLSTVRPRQLLLGKVVGIGLVGFLQLAVLGVVAVVTATRTHAISLPSVTVEAVVAGLVWFVLGFFLYALMFAAAGSLVSRQEDLASVTTPITLIIVGTYLAFFYAAANPDAPVTIALSIIPPFAPVLMAARIATGDAQAWQVAVAVVLTLIEIVALNALAARIYENSVLRVGSRVKLLEALRGGT